MSRKEVRVAVTGAAGQIGYALLFRLASGEVFGPDTDVHLQLLELEQALPALRGVAMELDDCAFPCLKSIRQTAQPEEAFENADWALLVGSVPRKKGMERSDLLKINGGIFQMQGKALAKTAKETCKVLVVGNPCNTNAWIAKKFAAGKIPEKNFFAMTMLDQNRAVTQIAQKAGAAARDVSNLAIWGNHSTTMFPAYEHAEIEGASLPSKLSDESWLQGAFLETVQKRGAAIIEARGASSAASAANAALDTVKNLVRKTPEGSFFSVAVSSDGSYGVPEGLMFSFPVRSDGSNWEIVQGLELSSFAQEKIKATQEELLAERDEVQSVG